MMEEVGEMLLVVMQVWRICLIMFVMGRFTSLRMRRVGILCEFHAFSGFGGSDKFTARHTSLSVVC